MKTVHSKFVFKGGVHPDYHKELSAGSAIETMPAVFHLTVPLSMHLGAPAKPVVKHGDTVKKNQLIAEASGFISAPVHAPIGGKVAAITDTVAASGRPCAAILIEAHDHEEVEFLPPIADWHFADQQVLLNRVAEAGIVGMGGAGFPTCVKLAPPPEKQVDTLILNGAECEPYLTSDHRMMVEHAEELCIGALIARRILGVKKVCVAIEDNKPDAIEALQKAFAGLDDDVEISILRTSYPHGSEKHQIFATTGREVPRGGLPMDVGCVVENISTIYAIYDAVVNHQPLTHRVVSVTGDAITRPANLRVPFGTAYADLIAVCGGVKGKAAKVVSGGPMMGFTVSSLSVPVTKTTSGIVLLSEDRVSGYTSQACISCGRCVEVCPMRILPSELSQCIEADDIEGAEQACLMDCLECGSCAYVCPAHRPLVHHVRRAKAIVAAKRAEAAAKK